MFSNYIKIAIRLLWKNKTYVVINLASLAFAIACCIMCYLNYDYRKSFDKNHLHTENVYRLNSIRKVEGDLQRWGLSPASVSDVMSKNLPGISKIVRLYSEQAVIKKGENIFNEPVQYTDKSFFTLFTFPLKEGNYALFDQPNALLISETLAQKYFGRESSG